MSVKLSVVIPAYNIEDYIGKCLDSVLKQTFQEIEIIVVDDGSTDRTPQILDQYAEKDKRITVIHKKNEGVSIARNTGIEQSTGEYFLFFDGDDFMEPETCAELYETAKEQQADTVIYGYHTFENGAVKESFLPTFPEDLYEGEQIVEELLPKFIGLSCERINDWLQKKPNALFVENPALWRTMVSADVVKKNGIRFDKDLKVGEDTIFISEYLSYAKRCYIKRKCYYYLVTRETSTIYVYEKKPLAKLEGKERLLTARSRLTEDIQQRRGKNIGDTWRGTVVMSVIELAFLLSKRNKKIGFMEGFRKYKSYATLPETKKSVKEFRVRPVFDIKIIPFLLLKGHCYFLLYLATWTLHLVHYEFIRN